AAVEIMHLNKEHRCPDTGDLFCRTDVTVDVEAVLDAIPAEIRRQMEMLAGAMPAVAIGPQCSEPWDCPFQKRCWPDDRDHISNLYYMGKKVYGFMAKGIHSLHDLPADHKCPPAARRQLRSIREDRIIVEPGLEQALAAFDGRLGFLDFETVQRAIPPWDGMAPWGQTAAQLSYHTDGGNGSYTHVEWLAEGPSDPRGGIAQM